jgi:uncharacterized protein YdcH (DUF465 family)
MNLTQHELTDECPEQAGAIAALRTEDEGFAKLADDFDALQTEIVRAETNEAPTDDFHLEDMKKRRLSMLDEISRRLQAA